MIPMVAQVTTAPGAKLHLDEAGHAHCGSGDGRTITGTAIQLADANPTDLCMRCLPAIRVAADTAIRAHAGGGISNQRVRSIEALRRVRADDPHRSGAGEGHRLHRAARRPPRSGPGPPVHALRLRPDRSGPRRSQPARTHRRLTKGEPMFTIKSTSRQGVVFGHYGTFDDLATAQLVAENVARVTRLKYGSSNDLYRRAGPG